MTTLSKMQDNYNVTGIRTIKRNPKEPMKNNVGTARGTAIVETIEHQEVLIKQLVESNRQLAEVLDPNSGTGTGRWSSEFNYATYLEQGEITRQAYLAITKRHAEERAALHAQREQEVAEYNLRKMHESLARPLTKQSNLFGG